MQTILTSSLCLSQIFKTLKLICDGRHIYNVLTFYPKITWLKEILHLKNFVLPSTDNFSAIWTPINTVYLSQKNEKVLVIIHRPRIISCSKIREQANCMHSMRVFCPRVCLTSLSFTVLNLNVQTYVSL